MKNPIGISERIDQELRDVLRDFNVRPFSAIPASYRKIITEFLTRKGKRLRPAMFVLSYFCYSDRPAQGLYRSAVGLELLHDFTLIHDDIIDRSKTRRNGPSMHTLLQEHLAGRQGGKFSSENMAMVIGDMLYALGIRLFLSVKEEATRKNAALDCLTQAALFTACGEIKELLDTLESLDRLTAKGIAETCRWKTAYYSFVCPMVAGALLGGAKPADRDALTQYGLSVGLAYQIQDDALDLMDGNSPERRKEECSDLRDGKRTLPLWYAFNNASVKERARLAAIVDRDRVSRRDLETARRMIVRLGGLDYAHREVARCLRKGRRMLDALSIGKARRDSLWRYTVDNLFTAFHE